MSDPVRMNYSKPQSLDTQEGADDLGAMGFIVKQIDELNNQLSRIDGTLAVSGKVIRETGKGLVRVDETKTAAGRRTIPLPAFAVATLLERRKLPFLGQQQVIFPSTAGTLRDPNNFGSFGAPSATNSGCLT